MPAIPPESLRDLTESTPRPLAPTTAENYSSAALLEDEVERTFIEESPWTLLYVRVGARASWLG